MLLDRPLRGKGQPIGSPSRARRWGVSDDGPGQPVEDELTEYSDYDLPSWVGSTTFQKLPLCPDDASLAASGAEVAIVGAPFDDGVTNRPGARFGPRAIRSATYHSGDLYSIQLEGEVFSRIRCVDAGDAPIVPSRAERAHRVIREKV